MLVYFLESFGLLSCLGILLVQGLVRELFEVFLINFFHHEVKRARRDKFSTSSGIAGQVLERLHPLYNGVLDGQAICQRVLVDLELLRQCALSNVLSACACFARLLRSILTFEFFLLKIYINDFWRSSDIT